MSAIVANCAINLNCELTEPVKVQYLDGNLFSMDNAGNTAHVYVYYNGQPQEIVGSVSADVIRADGSTVDVTGAMSGNRVYVIFPQAVYAVPGVLSVVIKVTEGTTTTTIAAFVANVYQSSTDTIVDPGTIIPSVDALIAAINAAVASIPVDYSALLATIAEDYSPSKPYPNVGSYAWYGGVLKRSIVPITTAETYDASHWTNATICNDVSALKSAINSYYSVSGIDSFGVADMPRNSYTIVGNIAKFTDAPTGFAPADGARIERANYNGVGNVSVVTIRSRNDVDDAYIAYYSETQGLSEWKKLPTTAEVVALDNAINRVEGLTIKRTSNMFDKSNANLINGYFGGSASSITSNSLTRCLYIPCEADTDYVIARNSGYYANQAGCTTATPTAGGSVSPIEIIDSATVDGVVYSHVHTTSNAAYLVLYYYNGNNHDPSGTDITYLNSMMISKGSEYKAYRDYDSSFVKYPENVPINVYGIFGVKFKRNTAYPAVMRTLDAQGMTYRQQIGETVERSDFDNVFPWCEMRECNVTVDGSGNKTIVYNGETGFSRSNNTFVEVPAFYFKRTVVNGVEEWAVSGKPFSGADIEPWFVNADGTIAKYRYISRYEGGALDNTHLSTSGVTPKTGDGFTVVKAYCEVNNVAMMSYEAFAALAHLMVIETCTFDLQSINSGISWYPYSMRSSGWNKPQSTGSTNTVVLGYDIRLTYINVGDTIYLSETGAQDVSNPRTVTAITFDSTTVTITFSGDAYTVTADTYCFPALQPTGRTDAMTYCNGRPFANGMNSPFQYRGIENLYGNVWTFLDGVRWSYSTGKFTLGEDVTSFTAPYQDATGSNTTTKGWIKTLGYDRAKPWATLPETVVGALGASNARKYITDEWNTMSQTDGQYFVCGGGWDHQDENGMFCFRTSEYPLADNWLYGYRVMIL